MLSASGMTKSFGGARALCGVPLDVDRGEIVAVVGENGAGKSTLLKTLAGVMPWDDGSARLDGAPYRPRDLHDAQVRGVALVFQELNVNRALGIAENVMLGQLRRFRRLGLIDGRRLRRAAQAVLDRIGADFSADDDLSRLDLGQLKIVEVARAIATDPGFVFFDESTAFLNNREAHRLMAVMRELKAQGIGVAFVSHHLQEVFGLADRLVVLKDGAFVGSYPAADMSEGRLHELMVGRDLAGGLFPPPRPPQATPLFLKIDGLATASGVGPITLEVPRGSVLGIGGLKGSGGEAILHALIGLDRPLAGAITLGGAPLAPQTPGSAWRDGIAYLPGDRTGEGVVTDFAVEENLTLAVRPRRLGIFADRAAGRAMAERTIRDLGIKADGPGAPVGSLSGGNMQKVVLGKCLAAEPRLLLLNNPTRGVDIGAKQEIYRVIRKLAERGTTILLVTEDLPELIGLSDRIVVTRKGRLSTMFEPGARPSEEEVVKWMM